MIRSPSFITVAVRKKDGSIKVKEDRFISFGKRLGVSKVPLLRGILNVFEMMVIGMRALNFSAEEFGEYLEDEPKTPRRKNKLFEIATMVFSFVISLGLALFLFKVIPLYAAETLRKFFPAIAQYYILFNLIDGTIRIFIFFLYIGVLSRFKSFHRIFEYHGAEHMAVHTYEKNAVLTVAEVEKEPPEHPRCGTSFIIAVFLVSIIVYSVVPRNPVFWQNLLQRIAIIPLIAAIGYEVLKWSAKRRDHPLVKLVTIPGLLTQKITTQKPDEKQIEVAIAALTRALESEKNVIPA